MFKVPIKFANCNNEKIFVISKEPYRAFDDESSSKGDVIGMKYGAVLQNNGFQQLTIKVKGEDQLPKITNEDLQSANNDGTPVLLIFEGCDVKCGAFNGREYVSANATGVKVVTKAAAPAPAGFPNPKA